MKLLAVTAAACVFSCSAFAADIIYNDPPAPPAPPMMPAPFNWSGAYIGVFGGVATGDTKMGIHPTDGDLPRELDQRAGGFIGGAQVGYDWQVNRWVLGAVADIAATNYKSKFSVSDGSDTIKMEGKLSYLGTVRARVGYAFDRTLVYGHGGFAYGKTKQSVDVAGTDFSNASKNRTGWTIGAGAEYAVTDRISLGTEYSYVDLGKKEIYKDDTDSIREDVAFHSVKAFLNIRF